MDELKPVRSVLAQFILQMRENCFVGIAKNNQYRKESLFIQQIQFSHERKSFRMLYAKKLFMMFGIITPRVFVLLFTRLRAMLLGL